MSDRPEQRPEGRLIGDTQRRSRMSQREAASRAGMSEARWRHIVSGYRPEAGQYIPVRGPAETLARMAAAVGVTPQQLEDVGRADAAVELRALDSADTTKAPTVEDLARQVAELQAAVDELLGRRGEERGA